MVDTVAELDEVFESPGYERCPDGNLEPGIEKVALFGLAEPYTHAARQLATGHWTSKLGNEEDIEHDAPDTVGGGIYGEVVAIMKRPIARQTP